MNKGFFNTIAISFAVVPDKVICIKMIGFKEQRLELPALPTDENPSELHVNIEEGTVQGEKYKFVDGEWKEIG